MRHRLFILSLFVVATVVAFAGEPDGFSRYWNFGRGYSPFRYAAEECIRIANEGEDVIEDEYKLDAPVKGFRLTFRAANRHSDPGRKYPYRSVKGKRHTRVNPSWGFYVADRGGKKLWVTVRTEEKEGILSSSAGMRVTVEKEGEKLPLADVSVSDGLDCYSGANIWTLTADRGMLRISAGNRGLVDITGVAYPEEECLAFGFAASAAALLEVSDISLKGDAGFARDNYGIWSDPEKLSAYLSESEDDVEGYWTVFDRTLEESLLKMGGDYRLAIVRDGERYVILYVDGAKVNQGKWEHGMVKGYLMPDPFEGIYSVEWKDAEGNKLEESVKAQAGEGNTLTIQFPYQASTLRLRKLPE